MIQYAIAYTYVDDIIRFIFGLSSRHDALAKAESLSLRSKKFKIISVFSARSLASIDVRNVASDPQKAYYER